ncbi:ABC transporter permease [Azorhizobium oxalatiphilum]|uniref:ABC transporter permease n=1 Tax=Azorhizobium oxalatiphilum TaxID=980631 RepID=A0A917F6K2_9HYPH|nr:ABC transporter permease [Azorhizobium oxalatiphilum]GGF51369.1 ABC transporter permease [Azorhizobium oxalatiphilum]
MTTNDVAAPAGRTGFKPHGRSWRVSRIWVYRLLFAVGFLAFWQFASGRLADPFWISSPSAIFARLTEWVRAGTLQHNLLITFKETIAGFLMGATAGVLAACVAGASDTIRRTIDPFVTAIYGLPKVALAPLFIMWFGIGMAPKIVLAAVSVFFLVFFSTLSGVREVDRKMVDALRTMGADRLRIQRCVILPAAMPWIFTGLKLGLPYGFVGAVAAEMMASNAGIGFLTQNAAGQLDTAGVFAALFALMVVTSLLNEGLGRLEAWIFRWR